MSGKCQRVPFKYSKRSFTFFLTEVLKGNLLEERNSGKEESERRRERESVGERQRERERENEVQNQHII